MFASRTNTFLTPHVEVSPGPVSVQRRRPSAFRTLTARRPSPLTIRPTDEFRNPSAGVEDLCSE